MKLYILKLNCCSLFIFCLIFSYNCSGQISNSDVVYAGRAFNWGLTMGSVDHVLLFRKDGTFCEQLEEPDWQQRITGRYREVKNQILLEYTDHTQENDTIFFETDEDGYESIYYAGAQMVRMAVPNKVPEGYYDYSSASSSGGMGTGMVYVGTQHYEGYNFYTNGIFDRNSSGGVMVSGNNVAGGTGSESSGKGKYTIKNGLLTLFYGNGTIEKHSFFYDATNEHETMIAIDGSIFFLEEESESAAESLADTDIAQKIGAPNEDVSVHPASSGINVLKAVKEVHGGDALDKIKTLEMSVKISGIVFKVRMDIEKSFIRLESMSEAFPYVEQLENDKGWIFQNGRLQTMPQLRVNELQIGFLSGILGLREAVIAKTNIVSASEATGDLITIVAEVDGNKVDYLINKDSYTLVATRIPKNGKNETTYLSNFKKVESLVLPFAEVSEYDGTALEVIYEKYIINPEFETKDWMKK